nr:MAG TPA: hypothetical protein [Caudoviricetes sp.]
MKIKRRRYKKSQKIGRNQRNDLVFERCVSSVATTIKTSYRGGWQSRPARPVDSMLTAK